MPSSHDATASYLGYVFQGQYALLALWDAADGDVVSVETDDDVVVEGGETRLSQLKHSTGTPAPLTVANVGVWKTIRIWVQHLCGDGDPARCTSAAVAPVSSATTRYLFVTVADVAPGDPLEGLVAAGVGASADAAALPARDAGALARATAALVAEAERVRDQRVAARAAGRALPHADRAPGCDAFLALPDAARSALVGRIVVVPNSFRITDVSAEVQRRLSNYVRSAQRAAVGERLIERWDRQVALALMQRRGRQIAKEELTGMLQDLIRDHGPNALPDDFGTRAPTSAEVAAEAGGNIERQIVLVDGGEVRVGRAIRDRWRARNQRERWIADDASLVPVLKAHDDALKEAWGDLHGPMCHDCRALGPDEHGRRGLGVLDWAHGAAPGVVSPPRPDWSHPFYVRGMLQQFADDLEVGWHPHYAERLGGSLDGARPSGPSAAAGGRGLALPQPTGDPPPDPLRDSLPPDTPLAGARSAPTPSAPPPRAPRQRHGRQSAE